MPLTTRAWKGRNVMMKGTYPLTIQLVNSGNVSSFQTLGDPNSVQDNQVPKPERGKFHNEDCGCRGSNRSVAETCVLGLLMPSKPFWIRAVTLVHLHDIKLEGWGGVSCLHLRGLICVHCQGSVQHTEKGRVSRTVPNAPMPGHHYPEKEELLKNSSLFSMSLLCDTSCSFSTSPLLNEPQRAFQGWPDWPGCCYIHRLETRSALRSMQVTSTKRTEMGRAAT